MELKITNGIKPFNIAFKSRRYCPPLSDIGKRLPSPKDSFLRSEITPSLREFLDEKCMGAGNKNFDALLSSLKPIDYFMKGKEIHKRIREGGFVTNQTERYVHEKSVRFLAKNKDHEYDVLLQLNPQGKGKIRLISTDGQEKITVTGSPKNYKIVESKIDNGVLCAKTSVYKGLETIGTHTEYKHLI